MESTATNLYALYSDLLGDIRYTKFMSQALKFSGMKAVWNLSQQKFTYIRNIRNFHENESKLAGLKPVNRDIYVFKRFRTTIFPAA